MNNKKFSIEVGSSIQLQFQRSQLNLENIIKEFIDNSLQSYRDNTEELKKMGEDKCKVTISFSRDKIEIMDNAYGMNEESFSRALRLNKRADSYSKSSLSQFGMGLKYAAISLGDEYTIETTALGDENYYKATINRELLETDQTSVSAQVEKAGLKEHYTKITITRLLNQITSNSVTKLSYDLSKIYNKYIGHDQLEIRIMPNNHVVKYIQPELWKNDFGSEYLEDFSGKVVFENKEYTYMGWIGILRTANVSDAGFSLLKDGRVIILNYRPEKLLGKPNTFAYQRIIGEIELNDFPVDFNKSSFSWKNGLEEAFIESVLENTEVNNMIKTAGQLRVRKTKTPKKEVVKKATANIEKTLSPLSKVIKEPSKFDFDPSEVPAHLKNNLIDSIPLNISYEGVDYKFLIKYEDNDDYNKQWLSIFSIDENQNKYSIVINNNFKIFKKLKDKDIELLQLISTILTITQISTRRTNKESHKFIMKLNEIIRTL